MKGKYEYLLASKNYFFIKQPIGSGVYMRNYNLDLTEMTPCLVWQITKQKYYFSLVLI